MSTSVTLAVDVAITDLTRKVLHHNGAFSKARLMALLADHHTNLLDTIESFSQEEDECYAAAI
jgi:hypothetical protein